MTRILAISGSLRARSSNTALLEVVAARAAPGVELVIFRGLSELPHFNPDLDGEVLPRAVKEFRKRVAGSDALLISTPEYVHGIPGALKNALDWLVGFPEFEGKPVGVICGSASEGSFALNSLIEILNTMSAKVVMEAVLSVPGVRSKFNERAELIDEPLKAALVSVIHALIEKK